MIKQQSSDHPIDVPAMPSTLPDANRDPCYQEAASRVSNSANGLGQKEPEDAAQASESPFVRAVLIKPSWVASDSESVQVAAAAGLGAGRLTM